MAYTMQQVVDGGREPLNDSDKVRYSDTTLLKFARNALHLLLSKRPDLFYGQFTALPAIATLALADPFPLDDGIAPAVSDYVTARAECSNDESVVEQRASLFFQLFREQVI